MDIFESERIRTQGGTKHITNPQHRREKETKNRLKERDMAQVVTDSRIAYNAIKPLIKYPEQEELFIICLTRANTIKDIHFIGLGTDYSVLISNKIIARYAVIDMACGVILVHTHPSGNSTPSAADIKATEKLREALKLFDIELMDHIVIGDGQYYSFVDEKATDINE